MAQYRNVKEFTDRIRKAYPKYREEYVSLGNALIEAKRNGTKNSAEVGELPKSNRKQRSSTMRKCESSVLLLKVLRIEPRQNLKRSSKSALIFLSRTTEPPHQ